MVHFWYYTPFTSGLPTLSAPKRILMQIFAHKSA
jgi:hypothetical protein